ncbi:MAG: BamA/TamA family outer membrane protein, partial [Rhodothermales bacterium]
KPNILIRGERNDRFEAFHLFESRINVSPDGKLAFVTKSGGKDVIHVYDLEGDELGPTYGFDDLIAVYSPSWSPDGTQLAFSSIDQSGFSDLYIYDTVGGTLHKLTNDSYDERDPAWSPDGRMLAFSSDRTSVGVENAYNLFTYDLETGAIRYITFGKHHDFSPQWSPDGTQLVFTSTRRDSTGRFGAQDIWVADMRLEAGLPPAVASAATTTLGPDALFVPEAGRDLRQLTRLTSAAYDPVWTGDGHLIFNSFENFRFTIRQLPNVDSLITHPKKLESVQLADVSDERWTFARLGDESGAERVPYRRKYNLDLAQGQLTNSVVWGTAGGAAMAFSDMLGNDRMFVTFWNSPQSGGGFLKSINIAVSRVQLHRRTNIGYGLFRFGGRRYDITDPDASTDLPIFWETVYGGFGAVSYPLSMFRRIEVSTSLSWSDKQIPERRIDREALLVSNAVSLVHDNALYALNGPVDGWRAKLTTAYTTDVLYSNVNYFTLEADVRRYFRLGKDLTFASRVLGRWNQGREARLFFMGGSWDLRGYRLFSVRGKKMWFISHELRFPILRQPSLLLPVLAPFGVTNLRGALFFDAAHAWNDDYGEKLPQINAGETVGAAGLGFRLNLFGGFVLRYDIGYRFRDGFRERSDRVFKQFFFGWDF